MLVNINYKKYKNDQKKQRATIYRLDRAYLSLTQAHRDLMDSHEKIKNRYKKRDKLFMKMQKGVKTFWKVKNSRKDFFLLDLRMMMRS